MTSLSNDIKYACRNLINCPLFTLTIVGILAIGIGGTTTMFSVYNANTLRPLPIPEPERVVMVDNWRSGLWQAYDEAMEIREYNTTFESMAAFTWSKGCGLSMQGNKVDAEAIYTSHELFDLLGVTPYRGSFFTGEHEHPGKSRVAVLSYEFWQRNFEARPDLIGQSVMIGQQDFTIVGIMEPRVNLPYAGLDLWMPVTPTQPPPNSGGGGLRNIFGRLKPGVTPTQTLQDLIRIKGLPPDQHTVHIDDRMGIKSIQTIYTERYRGESQRFLLSLTIILFIACFNVSGLLLARAAQHNHELGIRSALGATRSHLIQQTIIESLVLSLLGTGGGLILGQYGIAIMNQWFGHLIPPWASFAWDVRQTLYTVGIVLGVTLLSSVLPACYAGAKRPLRNILQSGGPQSSVSRWHSVSLNGIVVAEIAFALTLLTGAGLLFRSYQTMKHADPGYRTQDILMYHCNAGKARSPHAYFMDHLQKVRQLPGIKNAAITLKGPLWGGGDDGRILVEGGREITPGQEPEVIRYPITPTYLETMGIKLLSGRVFSEHDMHPEAEPTVIVNQSLADFYWPQQDPLDKRLRFTGDETWHRVVGLAQDTRFEGLDASYRMALYQPYTPENCGVGIMMVVLHTDLSPASLTQPIHQILKETNPESSSPSIGMLAESRDRELYWRRTSSWPYYLFAFIALTMALSGLYGIIAYQMTQRHHDIGIRLALGATSNMITRQMLWQSTRVIGMGLIFGIGGGVAFGQILSSRLFGVTPVDTVTFGCVTAILLLVSLTACYVPVSRVARIDPMEALRYE